MALDGAEVLILVNLGTDTSPNWRAVAQQRGLTHSAEREILDGSHKQADHMRPFYGKKSDTLEYEGLYVPNDDAFQALVDAQEKKRFIIIRRQESGLDVEEAEATIESVERDWSDNEESTVSMTAQLRENFRAVA